MLGWGGKENIMTRQEFHHLLESINALPPEQMEQLRRELDRKRGPYREREQQPPRQPMSEADFKRQLLESGLMTSLPTPADPAARPAFPPVKIEGEPLSETIIRERR
jgi:hypothetical protein